MSFELVNFKVEKGQKVQGYMDLPFTEDKLPTTIICGQEDGDTILITGGIHNAEYVGIQTVTGLAGMLEPEDIKGTLIMINIVNINGFKERTVSVSAEDGKNLNRVFPGDPEGTYTDKLAYFMEHELFSRIDYYIDVHNGDWFEDLSPFIYCVGKAEADVVAKAKEMASAADVPYYVQSGSGAGGAYNYAGSLGIPSVLLERGCRGLWTEEEVNDSQKDVRNILRSLGALVTERFTGDDQKQVPRYMKHAHYLDSELDGCWFPKKKAGEVVKAGETVGILKDFFGNVIQEVVFAETAVVLYQTISYFVPKNTPLIAYGHYEDCVEQPVHVHDHTHDDTHGHNCTCEACMEQMHEHETSEDFESLR